MSRLPLLALLVAAPALAGEPPPGMVAKQAERLTDKPEFQKKMAEIVNATAPLVDACVDRYTKQFAGNKGTVVLSFTLNEFGYVNMPKLSTTLSGSDNLRGCIKDVSRKWKFPEPGPNAIELSLTVNVFDGAKFKILGPGEKPEAPKPAPAPAKQDEGFIRFTPEGN